MSAAIKAELNSVLASIITKLILKSRLHCSLSVKTLIGTLTRAEEGIEMSFK